MAIKRSEAERNVVRSREQEIAVIEAKIDALLGSRGPGATFDCGHYDHHVRAEVERRFTEAGWKVTFFSDQREGSFWRFD